MNRQDAASGKPLEMKRGTGPNVAPNLPASIVVGIDPGLANTAVVVMEGGRIVKTETFTSNPGGKPDFTTVMERGTAMADAVAGLLSTLWNVEVVAIEGYEDFGGGHLRTREGKPIPLRWTTPAVCALIGYRLIALGYTVVWQKPSRVMSQYGPHKSRWKGRIFGLVPGDHLLTNDHARSAACHALAWYDTHKARR